MKGRGDLASVGQAVGGRTAGSLLGLLGAVAVDVELEDHGVMDEAVDGGGGGHGILEDPVPLAEDEVAGDEHGAALVALGHEGEEDLDLVGVLLDVADVVEDEQLEVVELAQGAGEVEVALGGEEVLDEAEGRDEEDRVSLLDEGVADGGADVGLAGAGEAEGEAVCSLIEEAAGGELLDLAHQRPGKAREVEGVEGLAGRQIGGAAESVDAALEAVIRLGEEDVVDQAQGLVVAGLDETLAELGGDGGRAEGGGEASHILLDIGDLKGAHQDTSRRAS